MTDQPEHADQDVRPPPGLPAWASSLRLTKEQLEAAERTRAFHLRQLQSRIGHSEHGSEEAAHSEH